MNDMVVKLTNTCTDDELEQWLEEQANTPSAYELARQKHNKKVRNRSTRQRKKLCKQVADYNANRKPGELYKFHMGIR